MPKQPRQPRRRSGVEYLDSPGRHGGDDHGAPHEAPAGSARGDRRATRAQTVRIGIFGGVSSSRYDRRDIPELRDRFRRR